MTLDFTPDCILIDDDLLVHASWKMSAKSRGVHLLCLKNETEFYKISKSLPKRIPIYIDSNLGMGLSGEWIAKEIHTQGFKNIHLRTGRMKSEFQNMPWLKSIAGKDAPDFSAMKAESKEAVESSDRIVIAGAGTAGLLSAILQAKRGNAVTLLEKRVDPSHGVYEHGRSVNFTLSSRGVAMLKHVGLYEEVLKVTTPLKGRALHISDREMVFQPYGTSDSEVLFALRRVDLINILLAHAKTYPEIKFMFECSVEHVDSEKSVVHCSTNGKSLEIPFTMYIAADGAASKSLRTLLHRNWTTFHFDVSEWGYKEFEIKSDNGEYALDPHALHLWAKGHSLICAIPNSDGSFVGNLIMPHQGEISFDSLKTEGDCQRFARMYYGDLFKMCPEMGESLSRSPVSKIVSTQLENWIFGKNIVVIGDACHSISPFLGQGMNSALEDAVILDNFLKHSYYSVEQNLRRFQEFRKPDTDALTVLSQEHLHQLRLHLGRPWQVAKHSAERFFAKCFPASFTLKYSLVAHGVTPYREALKKRKSLKVFLKAIAICGVQVLFFCSWYFGRLKVSKPNPKLRMVQ